MFSDPREDTLDSLDPLGNAALFDTTYTPHTHHTSSLGHGHNIDMDYDARRMSTSALSCASSHSVQSMQSARSGTTAATSASAYSSGLKRPASPAMTDATNVNAGDDSSSYSTFDDHQMHHDALGLEGGSPRASKRARPTLSLDPTAAARERARVQLPPLGALDAAPSSSGGSGTGSGSTSAPPTSHGLPSITNSNNSGFAAPTFHGDGGPFAFEAPSPDDVGTGSSLSPLGSGLSPLPGSSMSLSLQDYRRGSLPNLYSNSLAARGMPRTPFTFDLNGGGGGGSGHPQSAGLGGYTFPPPAPGSAGSGSIGRNGNGGHGTPTPTPPTAHSAPGSAFPAAGTGTNTSPFAQTPTTAGGSTAPSSAFPNTPLSDFHSQPHSSSSSSAYGGQGQGHGGTKTEGGLLSATGEWGVGNALPRISGYATAAASVGRSVSVSEHHGHGAHQSPEWFSPAGSFVLPSSEHGHGHGRGHGHGHGHVSLSHSPEPASIRYPVGALGRHASASGPSSSSSGPGSSTGSSAAQAAAAAQQAAAHAAAAALNVSPAAAANAASVAAQVAARPARRRGKLPKPTTDFLKDWLHRHSDHPYPSEEEKKQLCHATGLSMSQVSNWMINVSCLISL